MNEVSKKIYEPVKVAEQIIKYCISAGKKFIYISGNGGSGKTELSKIIYKEAIKYGHVNVLDIDDFVVDTKLRNAAKAIWNDPKKGQQKGRYTTSFVESYFLQNIKAIIFNIEKGNNYYHWPKKAVNTKECRLLFGDAVLTIIEGVGTVFLEKDEKNSVGIFLQCNKKIEISRRIKRGGFNNKKDVEKIYKNFIERSSQYKTNVEPHIIEYKMVLESLENYSLKVVRDGCAILSDL